jgi:formate hydrogenlyase subunit 6/NADH:ubiquinone oxidoreductase subunit I
MDEKLALSGLDGFQKLLTILRDDGYVAVGPVARDGAVVYDEIHSVSDLPQGFHDEQTPGQYRLSKNGGSAIFGYAVGPQSWKKFLYPSQSKVFAAKRDGKGFALIPETGKPVKYAFVGARPCEIAAILVQDKVFTGGAYVDDGYKARRENIFIVAVNCAEPGGTCFCASMGTGPSVKSGFDLALTEIVEDSRHVFLVKTGSEKGASVLSRIPHENADDELVKKADIVMRGAVSKMGRKLDTNGIKELLYGARESRHWEKVGTRCLTCANCTIVCPTCFCSSVEDVTSLTGDIAERWRKWDSCFTTDFTYIHGGSVRQTTASRYRHWITHKLASWQDQFGSSGCVGCGRCITWCPAGIDITEEVAALRKQVEASTAVDQGRGHEKP